METKREEKALREFKEIVRDLVRMLRAATGAESVYLQWVNRSRRQFVMEAHSTTLPNVMFNDRNGFDGYFLKPYRNLENTSQIRVGEQVEADQLKHYYGEVPVRQLTILPFINKGETVALTVLESSSPLLLSELSDTFQSFRRTLGNVLNTYLELIDLNRKQLEWADYEKSLGRFSTRQHKAEILGQLLEEVHSQLSDGSASLIAQGMGSWVNVLNTGERDLAPSLGLTVEQKSIVYDALENGQPEFAIHFNQNPKRLSTGETATEGASLAVPLMIEGRRHGALLVSDRNPLTFSESVKHKISNLTRVASLTIRANLNSEGAENNLLTSEYDSFIPDIWERAVDSILKSRQDQRKSWFGFLSIDNVASLRSRLRLEDLKRLQRELVPIFNPGRYGQSGYIGFNSDYVFTFLMQGRSEGDLQAWITRVKERLRDPVTLTDGQQVEVDIVWGHTEITNRDSDPHKVVQRAKQKLSEAVKHSAAG